MCNLILQNPLARGEGGRGKGKRGISLLAHHPFERKKSAHRVTYNSVVVEIGGRRGHREHRERLQEEIDRVALNCHELFELAIMPGFTFTDAGFLPSSEIIRSRA